MRVEKGDLSIVGSKSSRNGIWVINEDNFLFWEIEGESLSSFVTNSVSHSIFVFRTRFFWLHSLSKLPTHPFLCLNQLFFGLIFVIYDSFMISENTHGNFFVPITGSCSQNLSFVVSHKSFKSLKFWRFSKKIRRENQIWWELSEKRKDLFRAWKNSWQTPDYWMNWK